MSIQTIELFGFGSQRGQTYTTAYAWPSYVQAGAGGVVFANPSYHTAFFEAFPRDPNVFIRGEGATVELAEESARRQYERLVHCPGHEWEARGYENGGGFCKNCGSFASKVIPGPPCTVCGTPTWHTRDKAGAYYCSGCQSHKPLALWTENDWEIAYLDNVLEDGRRRLRERLNTRQLTEAEMAKLFSLFD